MIQAYIPCKTSFQGQATPPQHRQVNSYHHYCSKCDAEFVSGSILEEHTIALHSPVPPLLLQKLETLVHDEPTLRNSGYTTEIPTTTTSAASILRGLKSRPCARCKERSPNLSKPCYHHWGKSKEQLPFPHRKKPIRHWTCCSLPDNGPPCEKAERHVFRIEDAADLHAIYPFISTGDLVDDGSSTRNYQKVVALDCEMAYTDSGLEVVALSLVSLPTGTVLHDSLVAPDFDLIDDNFRFSGVKQGAIMYAEQAGTCLLGIYGARARVLEFVNQDTIIVGHGLSHDLNKLRLVHHRIIDTAIVYSGPGKLTPSLKSLAKAHLGLEIQADTANRGHSGTEDAVAAMNICLRRLNWPTIPYTTRLGKLPIWQFPIGFGLPPMGLPPTEIPHMGHPLTSLPKVGNHPAGFGNIQTGFKEPYNESPTKQNSQISHLPTGFQQSPNRNPEQAPMQPLILTPLTLITQCIGSYPTILLNSPSTLPDNSSKTHHGKSPSRAKKASIGTRMIPNPKKLRKILNKKAAKKAKKAKKAARKQKQLKHSTVRSAIPNPVPNTIPTGTPSERKSQPCVSIDVESDLREQFARLGVVGIGRDENGDDNDDDDEDDNDDDDDENESDIGGVYITGLGFGGGGDDYALCDKDCAWCGHCND